MWIQTQCGLWIIPRSAVRCTQLFPALFFPRLLPYVVIWRKPDLYIPKEVSQFFSGGGLTSRPLIPAATSCTGSLIVDFTAGTLKQSSNWFLCVSQRHGTAPVKRTSHQSSPKATRRSTRYSTAAWFIYSSGPNEITNKLMLPVAAKARTFGVVDVCSAPFPDRYQFRSVDIKKAVDFRGAEAVALL